MDVLRKERGDAGQATVELAVVLPVAIVLAVIVVNALSFFEACAAFDQLARQAICAYAPSPDAGQGPAEVAALVESELEGGFGYFQPGNRGNGSGAGRLLSALLRTSLLCPYAFRAGDLKTRCSVSRFRGSSTKSI